MEVPAALAPCYSELHHHGLVINHHLLVKLALGMNQVHMIRSHHVCAGEHVPRIPGHVSGQGDQVFC